MYKILIVEDDETIRNGIKTLLELQGYYVDIAVNGDLLCGAPVSGETAGMERLSAQLFPVWCVFASGGCAGGCGASSGDCGAAEYGVWRF